eukprot:m.23046 g.23046  ORF g.23046 m.23046 type:complete len:257 (+) comp7461_c0_seq2:111-881(+)
MMGLLRTVLNATSGPCSRWIPMLLLVLSVTSITIALLICNSEYSGGSSASGGSDGLPAISTLGSEGNLVVFGTGFFLMTFFLGAALLCRAAYLQTCTDKLYPVLLPLVCSWIGIPAIWFGFHYFALSIFYLDLIRVMGYVSDDSDLGWLHFTAAGVGMGLIGLAGILHGLCCMTIEADVMLHKYIRYSLYTFNTGACMVGLLSFGIWFTGPKDSAVLEWTGFFLVLAGYATFVGYFWGYARECKEKNGFPSLLPSK